MFLSQKAKGFFVELNDNAVMMARTSAPNAPFTVEEMLECPPNDAAALEAAPATTYALQRLHDLGAHLVIDDFSAGRTDFRLLRKSTFETLKISPDFVRTVGEGGTEAMLIAAATQFAHNLGLKMVAKGVETSSQLAVLEQGGCDAAQGYLFSRPVPAAEFQTLLGKPFNAER